MYVFYSVSVSVSFYLNIKSMPFLYKILQLGSQSWIQENDNIFTGHIFTVVLLSDVLLHE